MTQFKKGDRVTSTKNGQLPYWGDLTYVEKTSNGVHIAVRSDGTRGGFHDGGLRLFLDTSKPLQTVDGKRVSFIGRMEDGRIVVSVTYGAAMSYTKAAPTELRYADGRVTNRPGVTSGDDVIVKVVEKTTFQNVYADGRIGDTIHSDTDAAAKRSKYGKVRIGFLKTVTTDGVRTSVSLQSATIPWYRDASVPLGRAAVPADYAR